MIRYIKSVWWRLRDWAVGPSGWLIGDATSGERRDLSRLDRLDGLGVDAREVELDEAERAAMEVDEDTDRSFGTGGTEPLYDLDARTWDKVCPCVLAEQRDPECPWHGREVVFVDDGLGEEFEAELDQWERRRDS